MSAYHKKQNQDSSSKPQYKLGKKKKNMKQAHRPFYASTPRKKLSEKRNPENEIKGIYKQMEGGFGFVDTVDAAGKKQGFYVHESKKLDALEGDEVAFEVVYFKGKPEAIIKKVLERSEHLIVGTLKVGKTFAFVLPENKKIGKDIFIPGKNIGGFSDGARVAVQVINWKGKNPEGRIIESLASLPKGREDIYKIAFEMGARKSFGEKSLEEVKSLKKNISPNELRKRQDFRNMLTYTIDGAESKDLDDALSIEKQENRYRLYVHIADVAHYILENSVLDREARKRATSIYLMDQVIPMLPAELSNGLCSLHPGEDKLTLTCIIETDLHGNVQHSQVVNSVIQSDFRLTYREIDGILSHPELVSESFISQDSESSSEGQGSLQFGGKLTPNLLENLKLLKEFTDILRRKSVERGVLSFDFPETKIVLDEKGNPLKYEKYERYDSYKIIEECMVLANTCVGKMFSKSPFLYRVHENPDEGDVEKFQKLLESLGVKEVFQKEHILGPKQFQKILEILKNNPKLEKFQRLLLRTLAKARYSEKNLGHFGLALDFYSHFTSPIRRYSDLQIHRIIKEVILNSSQQHLSPTLSCKERGGILKNRQKSVASFPSQGKEFKIEVLSEKGYRLSPERKNHYKEILPKVARQCSEKSDQAEKMEYKVRDMLACKYMQERIGESFTGKISGMIEKGFFVELENTIEGFIEFGFTGYQFDSETFSLRDVRTGEEKHFGDELQVKCNNIDMDRFRIEFEMI